MIKAVFLDFDETIFDHKHSSMVGLSAICEEYKVLRKKSLEWLEEQFWILTDWNYHLVLSKELTMDEARIARLERLFRLVGAEPPTEDLPRLGLLYKDRYREAARAIPGIRELVQQLKARGYYLGIITNGLVEAQQERLVGLGLAPYFDALVASEAVRSEKPGEKIFLHALEKAGCLPHEAMMIGDAWDKDVEGAIHAGMKAIWFKRRENESADLKLAPVAASVEELIDILKEERVL